MRMGLNAIAGCAGLALAACSGAGTVTGENVQTFYHPALVGYAAPGGVLPLAAYGAPFGPGTDAAAALQAGLSPPAGTGATRFAATPAARAGKGGRVVLVFDGASDGAAICRAADPAGGVGGSSGRLRVMGVFCVGDDVASEAQLTTARPSGPTDQAFRRDMQVMLARLLPTEAPAQTGDCPPANRC